MRLFIAFDAPSEELIKLQKNFDINGIKLVKEFHLTLKFLGEVNDDRVELIKEKLRKIKFQPLEVSFDKLGVFPNESYIRVIWIALQPEDKITELKEKVEDVLKDLFTKEGGFKAHITLGRVKFISDRDKLIQGLKADVPKIKFLVDKFILYKSELRRDGPIYTKLEEVSLL